MCVSAFSCEAIAVPALARWILYVKETSKAMPRRARRTQAPADSLDQADTFEQGGQQSHNWAHAHAGVCTQSTSMADDVFVPCELCDEPVWFSMYSDHARHCSMRHRLSLLNPDTLQQRLGVHVHMELPALEQEHGHSHPQISGMTQEMLHQLVHAVQGHELGRQSTSTLRTDLQRPSSDGGDDEDQEVIATDSDYEEDDTHATFHAHQNVISTVDEEDEGEDEGLDGLVRRRAGMLPTSDSEESDDEREPSTAPSTTTNSAFTNSVLRFPMLLSPSPLREEALSQLVDALTASFMMTLVDDGTSVGTGESTRTIIGLRRRARDDDYEGNLLLSELMGGSHRVGVTNLDSVTSVIGALVEAVMCPICQDTIMHATEARKTKCGHIFCGGCIRTWLEQSKKCPVCMTDLEA